MEQANSKVDEFKRRVETEWAGDETAAAWQKHYAEMKEQLAEVTQAVVDAADARPGMSLLDLASGTGEPALPLARKVAPSGTVTATDLSSAMLAALRANADAQGVTNLETRQCDATELPFADGSFDRVTSRFGLMFFVEIERALGEIRRVLKPGGRVAFAVWGPPMPGTYFGAMVIPYMRRLAEKPDPDGPGPMRFAEPGKLARLVEAAGFSGVEEVSHSPMAPYQGTPEALVDFLMEIAAPFRNVAASLSEDDRRAAAEEVLNNLRPRYDGTTTRVTAPIHIITAAAP